MEKEVSGGTLDVGNKNPEAVVADDNIQTTALVQVSTVKTVEFKDDRVVRVNKSSCLELLINLVGIFIYLLCSI